MPWWARAQKCGLDVCSGRRGEQDEHSWWYHRSCQLKIATAQGTLQRNPRKALWAFQILVMGPLLICREALSTSSLFLGFRSPICKWRHWVRTRWRDSTLLALLLQGSVTHLDCWTVFKLLVLPRMNPNLARHLFHPKELRKFGCRTSTMGQTVYWYFTQSISFHPHPATAEYTLFSYAHGTFSRIYYVRPQMSLNKVHKIKIMQRPFFDHSKMKPEINNTKKNKNLKICGINNTLLNNQWID